MRTNSKEIGLVGNVKALYNLVVDVANECTIVVELIPTSCFLDTASLVSILLARDCTITI